MHEYVYNGPVMEFDKCVANRWQASTYATSERKAKANLAIKYKKQTGRSPKSKISLPGKVVIRS